MKKYIEVEPILNILKTAIAVIENWKTIEIPEKEKKIYHTKYCQHCGQIVEIASERMSIVNFCTNCGEKLRDENE